jgi:asparagine synthase (glutamine-hydrolysing)
MAFGAPRSRAPEAIPPRKSWNDLTADPVSAPRAVRPSGWRLRIDAAFFTGSSSLRGGGWTLDAGVEHRARLHEEPDLALLLDGETRDGAGPREIAERYRERGLAGLDALRGRFACVVIDRRRRWVVAQRDPLGHRPLFRASGPAEELLLSDSIDDLLEPPGRPNQLDRLAVAGFLCNRWPAADGTYYHRVRRVRPGFRLVVRGPGRAEEGRYWRLEEPRRTGDWLSDEEADRFPEWLDDAVARSSRRDRAPVTVSLSSGLDSVSVAVSAAGAARRLGTPLPRAFCLAFTAPECDERHDQRQVAAALGLPATFLPAPLPSATAGPLHELIDLARNLPAPPVNPLLPSFERLYRAAARAGLETVLTGNGGDEWLGVTPLLGADLLRAGRFRELGALARSTRRSVRLPAARVWWNQLWRFGARPLLAEAADRWASPAGRHIRRRRALGRAPAWLRPEVAHGLVERVVEREHDRAEAPRGATFYWREIERSLDHPLVAMTREEMSETGRRTGVALRAPFEDDELVERLARVPPRRLLQGGRTKGLVREYLADRLRGESNLDLRHQRKVSFTTLFRDSVRREAEGCLERLGGVRALAELGIVEPRAFERAVRRAHRLRTGAETLPIWSTLVMESWLRREVAA